MCHLLLALPILALPVFWLLPPAVAFPIYAAVAGLSAMVYWYAMRAMRQPIQNGVEGMAGEIGEVVGWGDDGLLVNVHNEIWRAVCAGIPLREGDRVEIVGNDRLLLRVRQLDIEARYFQTR